MSVRRPCLAVSALVSVVLAACDGGSGITNEKRTPLDTIPAASGSFTHPEGVIAETHPLADHPFGIGISRQGTIYVGRPWANRLERVDLPGTDFTGSVDVGSIPTSIAFSPSGQRAWVTNQWSQSVGEIDVASNTQVGTVAVPGDPFVLTVDPEGGTVYASTNVGGVHQIDPASRTVTASWQFGGPINGLALHPDGKRLYAVVQFGYDGSDGVIQEIDTHSGALLRTLTVANGSQSQNDLQGVAVSRDGHELYVADERGPLHVIDLDSGSDIATVPDAQGGFGLALTPDGTQLYMSTSYAGVVFVVDRVSRSVVKTLSTGGAPRRIVFDRTGATAIIANEAGWVDYVR